MSYVPFNPNVPEFPDSSLATSQPQLLNNFQTLFNIFAANHKSLDAATSAGNHTIVQLLQTLSDNQSPQVDLSEIGIYSKNAKDQTAQTFLRYQGNGQEFQYTNYQIYSVDANNFFTFLPGRIILYFGMFTTLPNNILNLVPPIARVIITANFCPLTIFGTLVNKPNVGLLPSENGYFTRMFVNPSISIFPLPACFYLVMANT